MCVCVCVSPSVCLSVCLSVSVLSVSAYIMCVFDKSGSEDRLLFTYVHTHVCRMIMERIPRKTLSVLTIPSGPTLSLHQVILNAYLIHYVFVCTLYSFIECLLSLSIYS